MGDERNNGDWDVVESDPFHIAHGQGEEKAL